MAIPVATNVISNPITGVFGNGQVASYLASGTFVVPPGVTNVRARVWGAGGILGGGGFSMRTITGLTPGLSIPVTVGAGSVDHAVRGGTSSFGSYCSATGGGGNATTPTYSGGVGSGGDINTNGGAGAASSGGGGVGGLFGNGGAGSATNGSGGNAGGGGGNTAGNISGSGAFGTGGAYQSTTVTIFPTSGMVNPSLDFIGVGGGGTNTVAGINGGGGGNSGGTGGFPGGGGGSALGAKGFVTVEY